jgi:hypothetical protein
MEICLFLAKLWPWALGLLVIWFLGSWIVGCFFGEMMLEFGTFLFLFFDICLPVLIVIFALFYDIRNIAIENRDAAQ